jgi:hypothetical protein
MRGCRDTLQQRSVFAEPTTTTSRSPGAAETADDARTRVDAQRVDANSSGRCDAAPSARADASGATNAAAAPMAMRRHTEWRSIVKRWIRKADRGQ